MKRTFGFFAWAVAVRRRRMQVRRVCLNMAYLYRDFPFEIT
jgi:hypothetical protein